MVTLRKPTEEELRALEAETAASGTPAPRRNKLNFDSENYAPLLTNMKGALVDDPEVMARLYASDMYPDEEDPYASRGFGVDPETGTIYQTAPDGSKHAAFPPFNPLDGGGVVPWAMHHGAHALGYAPFRLGSLATSAATAPLMLGGPVGMGASMAATAQVGAAEEGVRQMLGEKLYGDPFSTNRIATHAGTAGILQGGAGMVEKYLYGRAKKNLLGEVAPGGEAAQMAADAKAHGVKLRPDQITGSRSLLIRGRLASQHPDSAYMMQRDQLLQDEQVSEAFEKYMGSLSPVGDLDAQGLMAKQGAIAATHAWHAARARAAAPHYIAAWRNAEPVDLDFLLEELGERVTRTASRTSDSVSSALKKARGLFLRPVKGSNSGAEVPIRDLRTLHDKKMALDDMIASAEAAGNRNAAAQLREIMYGADGTGANPKPGSLLRALDDASPDYAAGRQIYRDMSPMVTEIDESAVGALAGLKDTKLRRMAHLVFDRESSVNAIKTARKGILRAEASGDAQPGTWNAILRGFFQKTFANAGKQVATQGDVSPNVPGKVFAAVMGDPLVRKNIRAAMTDEQYQGLESMMRVLQGAARGRYVGSDTWAKQEAAEQARSGMTGISKVFNVDLARPLAWVNKWLQGRAERRFWHQFAEAITSPEAMHRLPELVGVRPGALRARVLTEQILLGTLAPDELERPQNLLEGPR